MKTLALIPLLALLHCALIAQKVIVNPEIGNKSRNNELQITKIEFRDSTTVLHFTTRYTPGNWIRIPRNTYIQFVGDEKKHFIVKTEGIPFDEKYIMPDSGVVHYSLYFPKTDRTYGFLDYGEDDPNGWKIYDICLSRQHTSPVPSFLKNEWFSAKSGNPDVAFYEKGMLSGNAFFRYKGFVKKGDTYLVSFEDKNKRPVLVKKLSEKAISMSDGKTVGSYSKDRNSIGIKPDTTFYKLPLFKNDSATYSGYIKNYNKRYSGKTIALYVDNLLTGAQQTYVAEIQETGFFSKKIPLYYPQRVWVRSEVYDGSVYLEPGKRLFTILGSDAPQYTGELAALNYDLAMLNERQGFSFERIKGEILKMTPGDYKAHLLAVQQEEYKRLDSLNVSNRICGKAYQVKKMDITYDYAGLLFQYNYFYEWAYRDIKKPAKKEKIEIPGYPENYFDFVNEQMVNNKLAAISNAYGNFVNKLMFAEVLRLSTYTYNFREIIKAMLAEGVVLNDNDKNIYNNLDSSGIHVNQDSLMLANKSLETFGKDHLTFIRKYVESLFDSVYLHRLDSMFSVKNGFFPDVRDSQNILRSVVSEMTPLDAAELKERSARISDPFIRDYISLSNNDVLRRITANKSAKNSIVNEVPKTEADRLFDEIMAKYRGKVVYVDFWATWCAPCRAGIEGIAPLKEELKDENVVFVYITDHTSPQKTYENMTPTIKGEHYRVSEDEWRYLSGKFNIAGIPHYVLVDKSGNVVNPKLGHRSNSDLKELFKKYW